MCSLKQRLAGGLARAASGKLVRACRQMAEGEDETAAAAAEPGTAEPAGVAEWDQPTLERDRQVFDLWDTSGNGYLGLAEMRSMVEARCGSPCAGTAMLADFSRASMWQVPGGAVERRPLAGDVRGLQR